MEWKVPCSSRTEFASDLHLNKQHANGILKTEFWMTAIPKNIGFA
jgi:hypothetical protein